LTAIKATEDKIESLEGSIEQVKYDLEHLIDFILPILSN
jgi:cob(I)alamin adenosyltransferase